MVVAPFFCSFILRTLAWRQILGEESFIVSTLKGLHIIPQSMALTASTTAVIAGITYNFLPFMTLPLYASIERLDPRLLEAGADPHVPLRDGRVALDFAISGVGDLDDWTTGQCQTSTVQRLVAAAPELVTPELMERTKSKQDKCPEIRQLLTSAASGF